MSIIMTILAILASAVVLLFFWLAATSDNPSTARFGGALAWGAAALIVIWSMWAAWQ